MNELDSNLRKLLGLAKQGDRLAYQEFLQLAAKLVRNYLMKTLGGTQRSPERIEDLVQETLLTIHRKRDLYDPTLPIVPWIQTIAHHRWIDQWRSEKYQRAEVEWSPGLSESNHHPGITTPSSEPNPEEVAIENSHRLGNTAQIEVWMKNLKPRERLLIQMAKLEERPLSEVALKTGMSLGAVKVSLHRAIKQLKSNR